MSDTDAGTATALDNNTTAKNTAIGPDPTFACGLSLSEVVMAQAYVTFQGIVAHTLVLRNGGELDLAEVWLTNTLPGELQF